MKKSIALLVAVMTAIIVVPQTASATTLPGLYNKRYCEVFTITRPTPPDFTIQVYNTIGLNNCPANKWKAIDYNAVAADTGSILAVPNGPRRWLIDAIANGKADEPVEIGGLEMRHVAVLKVPSLTPVPYTEMTIARTTTWVFNKGHKIHWIVSPAGRKYALQAYTTNIDKSLRARNLDHLDRNPSMGLPEGWTYRTIRLKRQLRLKAPGYATIMRDGLGGTYQKFKWPKKFFKPVKKAKKKHHHRH